MPPDLADLLADEAVLEGLSRLAGLVEAHAHSVRPLSEDGASHLQDVSQGLAAICARQLDQSYAPLRDGTGFASVKPRVLMAEATVWTKAICQELNIQDRVADALFQDWFFGSVITAVLQSRLREEEWHQIDNGSIRKWVYADLRLFLAV